MKIQIFNRLIRHGESFRAPRSVQESIPVRKIYRDGVWLCGGRYSKMWRFQDVNYAVASEADQSEILMRYCSVINAWPDDAYVQVLTNNRRIDPVEFENTMLMHLRGDDMDRLREEYNQIVRERTEWSNNTDDDVLICDPEAEFGPVVDAVRGQNIRLAPDSTQHVNALELGKGYEAGEKPVSLKSEFILTLYEHLLDVQTNGRRAKSIIDRAVLDLYEEFSKKPQAPTLQDLYRILQCQKEDLAKDIVLASEIFTKGSLNTFAQPTNVQLDNRVLCFNIRDLGQQLRPIGMLVLMEVVMMRVMQNRLRGKRTWIYFDELSVLFSYEWSTNFLDVSWKRYRKYGALASGIFQNLDQALDNEVARSMISNSEFLVLDSFEAVEGTALSKAKNYSLNQKDALNAVLLDGRLELTNNLAERTVKPFVMARKNFLFCDTAKGADASALCFSVMETAKRNGLNPFGYLLFLLQELPKLGENPTDEQLIPLLPWDDNLPAYCRLKVS